MASQVSNAQFQQGQNLNNGQYNQPYPNFGTVIPSYPAQTIFMQPIGNIYGLSNSSEIGNIPIGSGVSVGLCLSEGVMYLKSMQNNGPALLGYKLTPIENSRQASQQTQEDQTQKIAAMLQRYDERFNKLEEQLSSLKNTNNTKGGKPEWQI